MSGLAPERVRHHAVRIDVTWYPVKQAFEVATGIPRREFTSHTARRHLAALGFEVRGEVESRTSITPDQPAEVPPQPPRRSTPTADLLLVTCVKEKAVRPAPAKDLYVSTLFRKQRQYAEASGMPWFILSAEHGLVGPDEWLAPYERYLPDTPRSFREAWGRSVVERLELLGGSLAGRTIEVHAGRPYVDALRIPMGEKGATLSEPLAGLAMGQRLAWYSSREQPVPAVESAANEHAAAHGFRARLLDERLAVASGEFLAQGSTGLKVPGLYSWWIDEAGAVDLSRGLGHPVEAGLIYAGLAGATRWPSGKRSTNTLWSRIAGMHLGKRHEFSTFRRTLGATLAAATSSPTVDEDALTAWMHEHLRVLAIPFDDADTLGRLETDVLRSLDPPLNLQGMPQTPLRKQLSALRSRVAG